MGKSAAFANDILELVLNGVAIPSIAQNHSSPLTQYWVSLHATDPSAGNQSTGEISYAGATPYARVAVARTSGGWEVVGRVASPVNNIEFPQCQAAVSLTANYAGIGTSQTGAGYLVFSGPLSPAISITNGTIPRIGDGSTLTET